MFNYKLIYDSLGREYRQMTLWDRFLFLLKIKKRILVVTTNEGRKIAHYIATGRVENVKL